MAIIKAQITNNFFELICAIHYFTRPPNRFFFLRFSILIKISRLSILLLIFINLKFEGKHLLMSLTRSQIGIIKS